jgi:hypothetical protein
MTPASVLVDYMHCVDMGVFADCLASTFVEALPHMGATTLALAEQV